MESSKKLLVLGSALIGLVILSCTCSATMTVSIDTDKDSYYLGENVNFTGSIVLVNEAGCCDLFTEDNVSLAITDGNSQVCTLEVDYGYYVEGGNCSLDMNVTETHPDDCASYGGNNTITYEWIYWEIPSDWNPGNYTATITATACGTSEWNSTGFTVATTTTTSTTTTTTIRYRSRGGGGGGGGAAYVARIKPSCFDGIKNCHDGGCEEDIDCGGPCRACPSCSDGIQNQGETGVDCGGPCPPCKVTTTTVRPEVTTTVATTITTTTTTVPTTTTTIVHTALTTTTIPPSPGIPLGITEGAIILTAIVLITIAFMIQTGRI